MLKKKISILALMLALMLTITACGGNKGGNTEGTDAAGGNEASEVILRANNSSEPGSLDPQLAMGTHESWILDHTFEGLMKYDKEGKLVPGMAVDFPEISEDGKTYVFTIRDDVKWSNGDPVTAEDFEFAWKRLADPETAAEYAFQLYYVVGAQEFNEGTGTREDVGVKALDGNKLEVQLKGMTPFFDGLTAFYSLFPVNEKVVTENPDWAKSADTLVSNGPFYMTTWEHDSKINIRKNENYYNKDLVKIDGIDFDIIVEKSTEWAKFESGELDIVVAPSDEVTSKMIKENDEALIVGDYLGIENYNFNTEVTPFNNVKVRKALSMAIDRKIITENVRQMGDTPAEGIVPFGLTGPDGKDFREGNGNLIVENLEEAKKLFEEGLAEEGMTLADFNAKKFTLIYNTNETHKKVTQALQEMWKQTLGIEIQIENMDFQVKLDRERSGDFAISRSGWIGDYLDPMTMLDLWVTGGSKNDSNFSDPEFDRLIASAKAPTDLEERWQDLLDAEKILTTEQPTLPLYFNKMRYVVNPEITGVYNTILSYPTLVYAEMK